MDASALAIIKAGNVEQCSEVLKQFVEKHSHTFDLSVFNQSGQWTYLWNCVFQIMSATPTAHNHHRYPECLAATRILSRDKGNLNQTTPKQFDCLLNIANIGSANVAGLPVAVSVEALKCLCNIVFQSEKCQAMCLKNAAIEGIVKRLRTYKDHNVEYDLQYFDMKLLFIITGLNPNVRPKLRDDFHGLTYLVETLDLIMREKRTDQSYLPDPHIELLCEILKVLYNITYRSETTVATEEEEEIQFRRLAVVLHDLLLCKSFNKDAQSELCSNAINLLSNVPTACFSELVVVAHHPVGDRFGKPPAPVQSPPAAPPPPPVHNVFDGHDVAVLDVMLAFLRQRLDGSTANAATTLSEQLSPILMTLLKSVQCVSIQRRYVRSVILPPLKDAQQRPEVGNTLRNHLCRLLTSSDAQVRDLVAELLFVICKENVWRMTKYTGYGNAAGMFANRGILGGQGTPSTDYSSDSEDSDTEEYKRMASAFNPVVGCYEPPRADPMAGMSDEQKEYEAMQLVELMEKLNQKGVVQPCRIGADGRPVPVEHILQLQEEVGDPQLDTKRQKKSDGF